MVGTPSRFVIGGFGVEIYKEFQGCKIKYYNDLKIRSAA
jgi:hypothetical protein